MVYVDGYVIPIPTRNLKAYAAMAKKGGKVWMEHGALQYCECVGDDMDVKFGVPFPKANNAKRGETMIFSFVVYKSRKHRDAVNAKVMKDPRLAAMIDPAAMPFDCNRMVYGGFKTLVSL